MQLLEGIKVQAVRADSPFGVGRSAAQGSGPAAEQAAHLVGRQCARQDRRDLNAR